MSDESTGVQTDRRVVLAHRMVQVGLLVTLAWKWSFFRQAVGIYAQIPIEDPFFPAWLRSVYTVTLAYLGSVMVIVLSLVSKTQSIRRACAWIALLGISILCVHQASYNDMTFVTAWWTSIWALWFVLHLDDPDSDRLLRRASLLSRSIIST